MSEADLQQWTPTASALAPEKEQNPLSLPINTFLGEAVDLVREFKAHWEAQGSLPKLKNNAGRLTLDICEEILSLRRAILEAGASWRLLTNPKSPEGLTERAREVRSELVAGLDYLLDDDIQEPADQQLAQLKAAHADDNDNADNLAAELYDYAKMAEPLQPRLAQLGDDFEIAIIAEAFQLSESLAQIPANAKPTPESQAALALRNRLLQLLLERVSLVRRVASFKYRNYPDAARKFTSSYERRRRAENRRKLIVAKNQPAS